MLRSLAVSLYRLPNVMASVYETAEFKLSIGVIKLVSVLLFAISAGFIFKMVSDASFFGLIILGVLGIGSLYYFVMIERD